MQQPRINVTPLIDVLLVLLIIFMVVSPMRPNSFKAKIPSEPTHDPDVHTNPNALIVSVGLDSELALNQEQGLGSVREPQKMIDRIRAVLELRQSNYGGSESVPRSVFIKAPRGLDYGSVAKVVDAVKASGADPIALQIDDLN